MQNLKNNDYEEEKVNGRVLNIETKIRDGNLYKVLQNLRKNSSILYDTNKKSLKLIRRKKQSEEKKKFYKDIEQDVLKPGDAVLRFFSQSKPLNTGDRYLSQKQKAKFLLSDRAYTKKPNIACGVYRKRVNTQTQQQKGDWISRKYSQFDRVVTEQSGALRLLMKKKDDEQCLYKKKKPIYIGKVQKNQKQLFSVFQSSNNDFYQDKNLKQTLSTNLFSQKFLEASIFKNQFPSINLKVNKKINLTSGINQNLRRISTNYA